MKNKKHLTIALAGNANVGKSAIFNQLTGLNQIVGNWPGKTVERAEGKLFFHGYTVHVIDLPGIYSLSTYSIEEIVSRDYIAVERPNVIINVVDSSALERNLYFTLQLLELEAPVVMDLNQVDFAAKKGIRIDTEKLSKTLGIPVTPTVATTGTGVKELLSEVIRAVEKKTKLKPLKVEYGKEIESGLKKLETIVQDKVPHLCEVYPSRWIAVKLLERDPNVIGKVRGYKEGSEVTSSAETLATEIERVHGETSPIIMASERYRIANMITKDVTSIITPPRVTIEEKLDEITAHKIFGYPILAAVMAAMFALIFVGGNLLTSGLDVIFNDVLIPTITETLLGVLPPALVDIVCGGIISGIAAGITIALPYIIPFYILLAILEDSGYLPRAAFLMDNFMHKIGLHGKAFIPLILGYGCNVPACIGCRIMETERERFLAGFVIVLIPCAAVTVVILGLVGRYVGLHAALALYLFDLILVFVLGRLAFRVLPGEPVGLIMEMPPYKKPSAKNVLLKTWSRTKDFVYIAFPLMIVGSVVLESLSVTGLMRPIADFMSPLITGWLGLPAESGIPLTFGILRKELTLILLTELVSPKALPEALTATQMIVFSLVTMIYTPCIATVAAMIREYGWKRALTITFVDITLSLVIGGITFRLLSLTTL